MTFSTASKPVGSFPSTGIDVLIVGTGLAGLTAAIECIRKGHNVRVLERNGGILTVGMSGEERKSKTTIQFSYFRTNRSYLLRRHVFHGSKRNQIFQTLA